MHLQILCLRQPFKLLNFHSFSTRIFMSYTSFRNKELKNPMKNENFPKKKIYLCNLILFQWIFPPFFWDDTFKKSRLFHTLKKKRGPPSPSSMSFIQSISIFSHIFMQNPSLSHGDTTQRSEYIRN